jgi:hypothetical protein
MPKIVEFDKELSDQIVALRNDGSKWDEISSATGVPTGKAMLIFDHATVKPKDRIKDATGKDIARLRDQENLSWGMISAITRYPESSCRSLYEEQTKRSTRGLRIGKGGRYPNGESAPKSSTTKKTVAKKAGAVAKKAAPAASPLAGKSEDEVKAAVEGYAIKVLTDNGTEETIKVKAVTKVTKTTMALRDAEGQGRTVKLATVTAVSKGKVIRG